MIAIEKVKRYLYDTQEQAEKYSGCEKVSVGAMIIPHGTKTFVFGSNKCIPDSCKTNGCRRIELYGEDSKSHRLPSDCRAVHSEIDAICNCAKFGIPTYRATMIVTRYPCEACARAIVNSGIREVYYGREQKISEEAELIFKSGDVRIHHISDWIYEDTTR